jgi:hypothetical protein
MQGFTAVTTVDRIVGTTVALLTVAIIIVIYYHKLRWFKSRGLVVLLVSYSLIVLAAFIFGTMTDDGYGWQFLPLMVLTAPWSFVIPAPLVEILPNWRLSNWLGTLLANFFVLTVLCGGLNVLLVYLLTRRIASHRGIPKIT